ncbi:RagB/SusD family nutrient uptake outer membrane protein [Pedobacter frigoris]|uniref:RagB/SusD family nutrient uptake outer membrane protein n=1 Tax=Pedobacter frigoris TaxID=2571272 RepID=A0A4V5NZ91_9SPHI|nr:RagB/SusD family nutrient uptake outer membrane protein [Pedobacter frigoris]TKC07438.1 RagB/SusD family nutrient uptake outer membrane protein [Pedobacter frigoris]
MKKISFIALALFSTLSLISCKKFLTVVPKTQMPQNVLFSTEGGFKDALTGAYIQMKGTGLYGAAMTQTTLEQLTSSWDVTSNSTEQRIGLFNYADAGVEGALEGIYANQYAVIASLNAILAQIDAKKDVFTTSGMYETIKSECLAMRAYCHFDVLRLYGPLPGAPGSTNMLPYVTRLSTTPNPKLTYDQFKEALFKDLTEAEALVKDIDPITQYSLAQLKSPSQTSVFNPADTYMAYRYLRLNYYAVKGIQARAYLWFNDKDKAYECAKLLIDAKNADGSAKFRLGTAADMTALDYVLTPEHIFGLYDFSMYTKYTTYYGGGALKKGTAATTITTQLYGNTGTDIREANLWELITLSNQAKCYIPKKYKVAEKPASLALDFKQIPMIRISEMYLIAAEAAPQAEGQAYWATFRTSRNIPATTLPTDPTLRALEIMKEFRKEFYAEGQSFFAYKRVNAPKASFLFAPAAATLNYLIPVPKTDAIN